MDSQSKITHKQTFTGGMNTSTASEYLGPNQYVYALNCDIVTSDEGNMGVISLPKGNIKIEVDLPTGRNKCIGFCRDEEYGKLYYAVWNSLGLHTWFQFDYASQTVKRVIQCLTDTNNIEVFRWREDSLILHANVVKGDLLYWVCDGDEARMISVSKSMDKSEETGYGEVITDEYTRAFKRPPAYAPEVNYVDDDTFGKNNLYGSLFKFAYQYIYDQGEYSTFSDFSKVPLPVGEVGLSGSGITNKNNAIDIGLLTGNKLVKKIRIVAQRTNQEGGQSEWSIVAVLDKKDMGIADDIEYTFRFYNNDSYIGIDQLEVLVPQSYLPRLPKLQEFTGKAMVYGNFPIGRPIFDVDFNVDLSYSDLFFEDPVVEEFNNPFISATGIDYTYEDKSGWGTGAFRNSTIEIVIGADVKKGNKFTFNAESRGSKRNGYLSASYTATANDNAETVAHALRTQLGANEYIQRGEMSDVSQVGGGSVRFQFTIKNPAGSGYFEQSRISVEATPVSYQSLRNIGSSVLNEKMGATFRYALGYEDEDGRKSLVKSNGQLVEVDHINELGGIKKVTTTLTINHLPPDWAKKLVVYRTKNLNQDQYIQMLIRKIVKNYDTTFGEEYYDLSLSSLFNYQAINDSQSIKYEFKKGDRVRFLKTINGTSEDVITDVHDYEVVNYLPEIINEQKSSVTVNGTVNVKTVADDNNIGNNIIINGAERLIVGVDSEGYVLNSAIGTSTEQTFDRYEIVVRGGVLRIKANDVIEGFIDVSDGVFPVVEVYNPNQNLVDTGVENYFTLAKFDIYDGMHRGNIQDQTASQPAIITVEATDNYVRNRGLITNDTENDPNVYITLIEDRSFSDFYVSDISSLGRTNSLDDSKGEVLFNERLVWSSNYIEDSNTNGLNMFYIGNRVDYNDGYGSIMRIMHHEGRMYILKRLKTGWAPVYGRIIQDQEGQQFLAASDNLLPEKMEYFLWEGGVGNNPESAVRIGNDLFGVSPDSGVIFNLGGNGILPISKIFNVDNEARLLLSQASASGVRIFGGFNSKKDEYIINIPAYRKVDYKEVISSSNWRDVLKDTSGQYDVLSHPSKGTVTISGSDIIYSANAGESGIDTFVMVDLETGTNQSVTINIIDSDDGFYEEYKVIAGQSIRFNAQSLFMSTGWELSNSIAQHRSNVSGAIENYNFIPEPGKTYIVGLVKSQGTISVSMGGVEEVIEDEGYQEVVLTAESGSLLTIYSSSTVLVSDIAIYGEFRDHSTLKFNDRANQFTGYASYSGDTLTKFFDELIVFKDGELWIQDKNERRNNYFGETYPSVISFYVNANPDMDKDIYSILLNSNKAWRVDIEIPATINRPRGQRSRIKEKNFKYYKNSFVADFMRDMNDTRFSNELEALLKGAYLQGKVAKITLTHLSEEPVNLHSVEVELSIK